MPYTTDEKLKSYLDTNQLHREQMCLAILSLDKKYIKVYPRHPRGGPDGGRDIEAIDVDGRIVFGAVGFINQATDSTESKRQIKSKFSDDLIRALGGEVSPESFVFLTNVNLTIGEKDEMYKVAKEQGIQTCEIYDRERLRVILDSVDGFAIRFQYLGISLSEAEQASFFSRWGDDIQSNIATGFQKVESGLNRLLFLQEAKRLIYYFTVSLELDRTYKSDEIGHYRFFCRMSLFHKVLHIKDILFGGSDKADRMSETTESEHPTKLLINGMKTGMKYGICTGQWETRWNTDDMNEETPYVPVSLYRHIGTEEVKFLNIQYSTSDMFRSSPHLSLEDVDGAWYIFYMTRGLAEKVKAIHISSNGYKLKEHRVSEFSIDCTEFEPDCPMIFTDEELESPWVRIRPMVSSCFKVDFF